MDMELFIIMRIMNTKDEDMMENGKMIKLKEMEQ